MFCYREYVRAQSLDEAYSLYQKKNNVVLGGMLWLKMQSKNMGTAIDLCDLGLDQIIEEEDAFRIGAYVSLRALETHEGLNAYTKNAMCDAVKSIVGVQFRNVATVGGSIWGRYGFSDVMTIMRALNAKVHLHHAGVISLDEFVDYPRTTRDILVEIIIPKTTESVVYLSQRNTATDFPVLTCCLAKRIDGYVAVVGATPSLAMPVYDKEGFLPLDMPVSEEAANTFAEIVAASVRFGSNARAGKEYRQIISKVLVKRAFQQMNENC